MGLPNSALKRARQAAQRRARNQQVRTRLKSAVKAFDASLAEGDGSRQEQAFRAAVRAADRAAARGAIHRNAARRKKSRLAKKLNEAAAKATARPSKRG
ncbi:MAG: 30S ribosomal protein S20 [Acetobacteraceae bacterium]|nr:30S ribosomal protein S20 [Acetobacteraceae bacterium]